MLNKSSQLHSHHQRSPPQTPHSSQMLSTSSLISTLKQPAPQTPTTRVMATTPNNSFLLTPPKSVSNVAPTATTTTTTSSIVNSTPIRPAQSQYRAAARTLTPSLSPSIPPASTSKPNPVMSSHVARINMNSAATSHSVGLNAPPKPPRRSSLKINH